MTNIKQNELDFRRGRQLAALRSATLPSVKVDDRSVGGRTMKAVLMAIDSRAGKVGGCWASAATLAADCSLSKRAVERAFVGLRLLSLIIETPVRRGSANCKDRRIVFANLVDYEAETIETENSESHRTAFGVSETVHTEPGAVHTEPGARPHRTAFAFTPNGVRSKGNEGQIEESIEGQTPGGFLQIDSGEGNEIEVGQLVEAETLDRIYRQAVESGSLKDCDASRLAVFGFAFRCHRKRDQLNNAVGFFLFGITKGLEWLLNQVDDQTDRKLAVKLLKRLRGDCEARTGDLIAVGDRQANEARTFEEERNRQRAALAAEFGGLN